MPVADIPSDHDFFDPDYVRGWLDWTTAQDTERPAFFDAFVARITALGGENLTIAELGSGPGVLAEQVLTRCSVGRYFLMDFSPEMHVLARDRLGDDERVIYVEANFKEAEWTAEIAAPVDVVVSVQALHELRHSSRAPTLYRQMGSILRAGGLVLVCDQLRPPGDDRALFMSVDEHLAALADGGFVEPTIGLHLGSMAFFEGRWSSRAG